MKSEFHTMVVLTKKVRKSTGKMVLELFIALSNTIFLLNKFIKYRRRSPYNLGFPLVIIQDLIH